MPTPSSQRSGSSSRATRSISPTPGPVFVLCGQSNMEGKAQIVLLEHQARHAEDEATRERFAHWVDGDGWKVRDDVFVRFLDRKGPLTVGFGSRDRIGPELDFGHVVGEHFDEPVLIVKTAWGGKSLYRDFRPPSAGLPPAEVLAKDLENAQKRHPERTAEEIEASYGHFYRESIRMVKETLADPGSVDASLAGRKVELRGFVWFQGWNDMINDAYTSEYTENMAHFIRDVRRDLEAPELPFVIGQFGVGGENNTNKKHVAFKQAQAAAAQRKEFDGNVALVRTDAFWDHEAQAVFDKGWRENLEEWQKVGSDRPYHYLGSAKTYCDIGKAFGEACLALLGERSR